VGTAGQAHELAYVWKGSLRPREMASAHCSHTIVVPNDRESLRVAHNPPLCLQKAVTPASVAQAGSLLFVRWTVDWLKETSVAGL
jgi:hypothetical protein